MDLHRHPRCCSSGRHPGAPCSVLGISRLQAIDLRASCSETIPHPRGLAAEQGRSLWTCIDIPAAALLKDTLVSCSLLHLVQPALQVLCRRLAGKQL